VIIPTGEIGDDLAFYLQQSHQIPSVVALGVHVDTYGRVQAAGGVLIELMPGHTEVEVRKIEERVRSIEPISKRILEGASAKDLVTDFLADFRLVEMEHDHTVRFQCRCSSERVERSVALLGLAEIDQLIQEGKTVDVDCEFCGKRYQIGLERLGELRKQVYRSSLN
jgi:molecular chaperone Hsp33